jgi:hypothetical protein
MLRAFVFHSLCFSVCVSQSVFLSLCFSVCVSQSVFLSQPLLHYG